MLLRASKINLIIFFFNYFNQSSFSSISIYLFWLSLNVSFDQCEQKSRWERNRRFRSKRSKSVSQTPLNLFSQLIECFHGGQWPLSPLRFCFPWSGLLVFSSIPDEKSPFMDRFKASRNVKCRFSPPFNAATSTGGKFERRYSEVSC